MPLNHNHEKNQLKIPNPPQKSSLELEGQHGQASRSDSLQWEEKPHHHTNPAAATRPGNGHELEKQGWSRERRNRQYPLGTHPGFATAKIHSIHGRLGGLPELSPRYSGSIIMGRNSNYFACLSGNCNISCLLNDSSSGDYFHIKPRSVCCHFKKN